MTADRSGANASGESGFFAVGLASSFVGQHALPYVGAIRRLRQRITSLRVSPTAILRLKTGGWRWSASRAGNALGF